VICLWSFARP